MKILHYLCVGGYQEKLIGINKQHQQLPRPSVKMAYKQAFEISDSICLHFIFLPIKHLPVVSLWINFRPIVTNLFTYLYIFIFLSFFCGYLFIYLSFWVTSKTFRQLFSNPGRQGTSWKKRGCSSTRLNWKSKGKTGCEGIWTNMYPDIYLAINWVTSSTLVQMTSVSMQVQFPLC